MPHHAVTDIGGSLRGAAGKGPQKEPSGFRLRTAIDRMAVDPAFRLEELVIRVDGRQAGSIGCRQAHAVGISGGLTDRGRAAEPHEATATRIGRDGVAHRSEVNTPPALGANLGNTTGQILNVAEEIRPKDAASVDGVARLGPLTTFIQLEVAIEQADERSHIGRVRLGVLPPGVIPAVAARVGGRFSLGLVLAVVDGVGRRVVNLHGIAPNSSGVGVDAIQFTTLNLQGLPHHHFVILALEREQTGFVLDDDRLFLFLGRRSGRGYGPSRRLDDGISELITKRAGGQRQERDQNKGDQANVLFHDVHIPQTKHRPLWLKFVAVVFCLFVLVHPTVIPERIDIQPQTDE